MKKIIFIMILCVAAFGSKAQTNPFPNTDSLVRYINRWIRNSPVEAFQNLRMNTALIGIIRFIQSGGGGAGGGIDTAYAINDSTLRLTTDLGLFTITIKGGRDVDSLFRSGDSLRFIINGTQHAVAAATNQSVQQVVNTGNTISDANDSLKIADGSTFTIHAGTGAAGANLILKALQASVSHTRLVLFPSVSGLEYRDLSTGNIKSLTIGSSTGMTFTDQVSTTGLGYAANYRTNGLANFGARWIPDIGAVRQEISDSLSGGGGGGSIKTGYGLLKVSDTMKVDTAYDKISTRYADYNINHHNLNAQPFVLQQMQPGTMAFAADASCVRLPNGKILAIYARTPTGNDFNGYVLYSATIDSLNKVEQRGVLFTGGFVSESSQINPNAFLLPDGNIGLIFQGYNSESDVQLYFTQSSDGGVTWASKTQILTDADVGHLYLVYPDRVVRDIAGNYWLPFAVNTDDDPSTVSGDYTGRFMKSTDGTTWVLQNTTITASTNDVFEPGMYESDVSINDAAGNSVKKMVYYWRSRQGTIMYKDSAYDAGSYSSSNTAMGVETPNAPVTVKAYNKRLYASYNAQLTNAGTGQEDRNKLVFAMSNVGENSFKTVATVYQNKHTDTITPFEPTIYIDTTDNSTLIFYSTIYTATNYGDLLVSRYNNVFTNMGANEFNPGFPSLEIYGGKLLPGGSNDYYLTIFNKTAKKSSGFLAFGNGISDQSAYIPYINSKAVSTASTGTQWYSRIGQDNYDSPFSAAFVINGQSNAGGTVSNQDILAVLNNSSVVFRAKANGTTAATAPADNDSSNTLVTSGWVKRQPSVNSQWATNGSGNIYFPANNTTKFVGIGTPTPAYPIDIRVATTGTNGYSFMVADSNSSLGATMVFGWPLASSSADRYKAFFIDGNGLNFGTLPDPVAGPPTAQMTLRNGGNFGIGITSPSWKFHVVGSVGFDLGSDATGDTWSRGSGGNLQRLAIGSANYIKTSTGSAPQWSSPSTVAANLGLSTGFYTPTLTNTTNVSASTAYQFQWTRNGNVITFSGEIDIDPTTTATLSVLTITLPVVGSFTNSNECAGTASDDLGTSARVRATPSAGTAEIRFTPIDVTNRRFSVHGTYYYTAP